MEDAFGTEIVIGDVVAVCAATKSHGVRIRKATVVGFTEHYVSVKWIGSSALTKYDSRKAPKNLIILEEAL